MPKCLLREGFPVPHDPLLIVTLADQQLCRAMAVPVETQSVTRLESEHPVLTFKDSKGETYVHDLSSVVQERTASPKSPPSSPPTSAVPPSTTSSSPLPKTIGPPAPTPRAMTKPSSMTPATASPRTNTCKFWPKPRRKPAILKQTAPASSGLPNAPSS